MNSDDPDNTELDALFMRAGKHAEVRVALFASMLEAEMYTLVPRGQSTRQAESIARTEGRRGEFKFACVGGWR